MEQLVVYIVQLMGFMLVVLLMLWGTYSRLQVASLLEPVPSVLAW